MKIFAIIPSAGLGRRMNSSLPKQYIKVNNQEILLYTLKNIINSKYIDSVYIVVAKDFLNYTSNLLEKKIFSKKIELVIGGKERQDSVYNALVRIPAKKGDLILIHDAARPFIKSAEIDNIIKFALIKKNVIAAQRAKDTIKIGKTFVQKTLNRNEIWLVQTPQIFEYSKLIKAFDNAYKNKIIATDDSSLLERINVKVYIYETNFENRKITTLEDLAFAKSILK